MPYIAQSLLMPFTSQQMYDLINDVGAYPDFLPWCKSAVVHAREITSLHATISIGKGPITQSITTINTMIPNQQIKMLYQAGSFKKCAGEWKFIEVAEGTQCQVQFNMEYEFVSKLQSFTIEPIFSPLANALISSFYARAEELYAK